MISNIMNSPTSYVTFYSSCVLSNHFFLIKGIVYFFNINLFILIGG